MEGTLARRIEMKKAMLALSFAVAGMMLAGCQSLPNDLTASKTVYSGVLPCADCAGIRTTLTLYRDQHGKPSRYQLQMQYLGTPGKRSSHTDSGSWMATTTTLNGYQYPLYILNPQFPDAQQRFLRSARNAVEMVGADGKPADSGLNYTLMEQ